MGYRYYGKRLAELESGLIVSRERLATIHLDAGSDIAEQIAAQELAGDFQLTANQRQYIMDCWPLDAGYSSARFRFDLDSDITDEALSVYVRKPLFPTIITRGKAQ